MELKLLLSQLTEVEKDDLYRLLWIEYVKEDIRSYLESQLLALSKESGACY